jgi:hypothetical protein
VTSDYFHQVIFNLLMYSRHHSGSAFLLYLLLCFLFTLFPFCTVTFFFLFLFIFDCDFFSVSLATFCFASAIHLSDVLAWLWPGFSWPWLHFFQARAKVYGLGLALAWGKNLA